MIDIFDQIFMICNLEWLVFSNLIHDHFCEFFASLFFYFWGLSILFVSFMLWHVFKVWNITSNTILGSFKRIYVYGISFLDRYCSLSFWHFKGIVFRLCHRKFWLIGFHSLMLWVLALRLLISLSWTVLLGSNPCLNCLSKVTLTIFVKFLSDVI